MPNKPIFQKLEEFQLVPSYGDRAAAAAAGVTVPAYVPTDPVKGWVMTEAMARAVPGVQLFTFRDETLITFPVAFFGKATVVGGVTVGVTESMTLPLNKLGVFNMLPEEPNANIPGLGYAWPVPLRALTAVQRLERVQMSWQVRNLDAIPEVALTPGEQIILNVCNRIAARVGA